MIFEIAVRACLKGIIVRIPFKQALKLWYNSIFKPNFSFLRYSILFL